MSPSPVRALFVSPHGHRYGGAERQLATLAQHADPSRLTLTFALLEPGPLADDLRAAGHAVLELPGGRLRDPGRARRLVGGLRAHVRAVDPDVTVAWLPVPQLYLACALAGRRRRPRRVLWIHDTNGDPTLRRLAGRTPLDAIVACSATARDRDAALPLARRAVPRHVVHPGVDVPAPARSRPALRAELGVGDGAAVVGVVGRLVRRKNVDGAAEAVARLRRDGADVHLLVIGGDLEGADPAYADEVRALASRSDLAGAVHMTGPVDRATELFPALDVLLHAAPSEDFGLTLIEAFALGVPVVAVAQGGPTEIAPDGEALLVPDAGPAALARGLAAVLDDPDRAAELAVRGRARHAAAFTADAVAARTASLLEAVAGR